MKHCRHFEDVRFTKTVDLRFWIKLYTRMGDSAENCLFIPGSTGSMCMVCMVVCSLGMLKKTFHTGLRTEGCCLMKPST